MSFEKSVIKMLVSISEKTIEKIEKEMLKLEECEEKKGLMKRLKDYKNRLKVLKSKE